MSEAQTEKLLREKTVLELTGLGRSTMYRLMRNGEFPRSRHYAGLAAAFSLSSEIDAWIEWQKSLTLSQSQHWIPPLAQGCH